MEYRDYYATLNVPREADQKQIRDAFRKLARKFHPDVNPGDAGAEAKFKEINEAYEVLSNPEKRKKYDSLGADWERIERDEEVRRRYASEGPASADFSDFFSTFFGGRGGARAARGGGWDVFFGGEAPARGLDLEVEVPVTLREAAHGGSRHLELQVEDTCTQCGGRGMVANEARREGQVRVTYNAHPCPQCHGSGIIPGRRSVNVRIPAGVTDGTRLRLAGQGGKGTNGGAGDLYVRVRLLPHPVFRVSERDLLCELPVWDFEAALGGQVEVPTLDGRVRLRIPAGTQSGQTLRLRGKGLPGGRGKSVGDLLYTVKIVVPSSLDDEEKELLGKLRDRVAGHQPDPRESLFREAS